MLGKTENQKKGILLLDEIYLRSSISVNSRTLTYSGLEDFGGELTNRENEKADHGLVFMWASLADSFTQPIAVFASKGPVEGMNIITFKIIIYPVHQIILPNMQYKHIIYI